MSCKGSQARNLLYWELSTRADSNVVEKAIEEIAKMNYNSWDQMSFTKKLKDKKAQLVSVMCNL